MIRPRVLLLSVLALAALALAACGSDEEANDYVDQVNDLQVELVAEVTDTVSAAPPANPEAAAEVATDLKEVFDTSADQFEAVEPPEDVADLHEQLVAAIRDVGARIGDAEQAFSSDNPQQAAQAALELQSAATDLQTELNTVIDDINAQLQE